MSNKKQTKKQKDQALEQERLRLEAYEKSVDDRVTEVMELSLEEQKQRIREFIVADDNRKVRERELVDQLRDCVTMLESVRRENNSDSDSDSDSNTELEDLHTRVIGI